MKWQIPWLNKESQRMAYSLATHLNSPFLATATTTYYYYGLSPQL